MDAVALTLAGTPAWTYLGGDDQAKKPLEVIVRAFDREVDFAIGAGAEGPGQDASRIPPGEGRRLEGRHFYVRPTVAGAPCRISYRGV
ncbi:MAG: hypothetical protein O2894_02000 [Planctomycetota bacterium]|nr:hypothetical protein [Planctomycetota bacterium]